MNRNNNPFIFKFCNNQRGAILVEFVLILPIILMLTFPTIDYARYIMMQQKAVKVSYVIADMISLSQPIADDTTQQDVNQDGTYIVDALFPGIMNSVPTLMLPYKPRQGQDLYQIVVSHVRAPSNGNPQITWQYDENSRSFDANGRTSTIGVVSRFDNTTTAALPSNLASGMKAGDNMIVVEATLEYEPITPGLGQIGLPFLTATQVSYRAIMPARYGNLQYIWQVHCPPANTEPGC